MLRKTLIRRQHVHPEAGRYAQATFHDGAHRQAPGDSTPWRDTTNPLLKLRTWWMAPAAKGSIIAAWSCTIVVFSYCWSLQIDAKGTYTMNNVLLRNLHQEAVRADAAEERAKSMQILLAEAQAAAAENLKNGNSTSGSSGNGEKKESSGGGFLGLFGKKKDSSNVAAPTVDANGVELLPVPAELEPLPPAVVPKKVLDNNNSMINYELELTREQLRAKQLHERNQALVMEMNKLRAEMYTLRKENKDLEEIAKNLRRSGGFSEQ